MDEEQWLPWGHGRGVGKMLVIQLVVVQWMLKVLKEQCDLELNKESEILLVRLLDAAHHAICNLAVVPETLIDLPFISGTPSGPVHLKVVITRDLLRQLIRDLLDRKGRRANFLGLASAFIDSQLTLMSYYPNRPHGWGKGNEDDA